MQFMVMQWFAVPRSILHRLRWLHPGTLNCGTSIETASEMRATGSHWTFAPNLDLARDADGVELRNFWRGYIPSW